MARKTKEDAEATRQALLDAALRVFGEQGYSATRLEDVALAAGVTRGAIYWHFANKADLYNAAIGYATGRSEVVAARALAAGGSPLAFLRHLLIGFLAFAEEDAAYRASLEITFLKTEMTPELDEGMRQKKAGLAMVLEQIANSIRHGIATGEIRADLDPLVGARAFMVQLNGAVLYWLLDPQAFSLKASAPQLADLYIRSIAAADR